VLKKLNMLINQSCVSSTALYSLCDIKYPSVHPSICQMAGVLVITIHHHYPWRAEIHPEPRHGTLCVYLTNVYRRTYYNEIHTFYRLIDADAHCYRYASICAKI